MDPCSECLAYELQAEHLLPRHGDQRDFLTTQWKCVSQLAFVIYRLMVAFLICIWLAVDFFKEGGRFYSDNMSYWLIFATNWGFLILAADAIIRALAALCHYFHSRKEESGEEAAGPAGMALWVIYNISANVALIVTLAYYTFLTTIDISALGFMNTPMCVLKHTLNTLYIVCDLLLCAIPIRLLHMVYPMTIGAIYVAFNAIYFNNGGEGPDGRPYTYHVMDWRKPAQSISSSALGFVMTAFMQCLLYGLYRLRIYLHTKFSTRKTRQKHFEDVQPVKEGVEVGLPEEENCLSPVHEECVVLEPLNSSPSNV